MKSEQSEEITQKATEQLVAALQQGHSETLTRYLKAIGRFHRYSLHKVLLTALQKPKASHVAGFRTWNQLDLHSHTDGLRKFAVARNIAIEYSEDIAPARGTSYGKRIAPVPGQSSAEEFSTLTHELAHR
jgi:hypothetical protein